MSAVKVAVRARPLSLREQENDSSVIISMNGPKVTITDPRSEELHENEKRLKTRDFFFDYCFWSADRRSSNFFSQKRIFQELGSEVLNSVFEGYNICIFAYGQSGSGKTYTMFGSDQSQTETGLIPRLCEALFDRITAQDGEDIEFQTSISYMEIYNEHVYDLLDENSNQELKQSLRIREHPLSGPYVQDLSQHFVQDYDSIKLLLEQGNNNRRVAATQFHQCSSRGHAIFTVNFSMENHKEENPTKKSSKIHLVDLAGSERANAEYDKMRLKEGANINKSLVTLGSVISSLAERSATQKIQFREDPSGSSRKRKQHFVPYRDSTLTWILKETLGGNAKTFMIATISPASSSFYESLSTLRYAQRAKNIVNKPIINEDPNMRIIRDLRQEISNLKSLLFNNGIEINLRNTLQISQFDGKISHKCVGTSSLELRASKLSQDGIELSLSNQSLLKIGFKSVESFKDTSRSCGNINRIRDVFGTNSTSFSLKNRLARAKALSCDNIISFSLISSLADKRFECYSSSYLMKSSIGARRPIKRRSKVKKVSKICINNADCATIESRDKVKSFFVVPTLLVTDCNDIGCDRQSIIESDVSGTLQDFDNSNEADDCKNDLGSEYIGGQLVASAEDHLQNITNMEVDNQDVDKTAIRGIEIQQLKTSREGCLDPKLCRDIVLEPKTRHLQEILCHKTTDRVNYDSEGTFWEVKIVDQHKKRMQKFKSKIGCEDDQQHKQDIVGHTTVDNGNFDCEDGGGTSVEVNIQKELQQSKSKTGCEEEQQQEQRLRSAKEEFCHKDIVRHRTADNGTFWEMKTVDELTKDSKLKPEHESNGETDEQWLKSAVKEKFCQQIVGHADVAENNYDGTSWEVETADQPQKKQLKCATCGSKSKLGCGSSEVIDVHQHKMWFSNENLHFEDGKESNIHGVVDEKLVGPKSCEKTLLEFNTVEQLQRQIQKLESEYGSSTLDGSADDLYWERYVDDFEYTRMGDGVEHKTMEVVAAVEGDDRMQDSIDGRCEKNCGEVEWCAGIEPCVAPHFHRGWSMNSSEASYSRDSLESVEHLDDRCSGSRDSLDDGGDAMSNCDSQDEHFCSGSNERISCSDQFDFVKTQIRTLDTILEGATECGTMNDGDLCASGGENGRRLDAHLLTSVHYSDVKERIDSDAEGMEEKVISSRSRFDGEPIQYSLNESVNSSIDRLSNSDLSAVPSDHGSMERLCVGAIDHIPIDDLQDEDPCLFQVKLVSILMILAKVYRSVDFINSLAISSLCLPTDSGRQEAKDGKESSVDISYALSQIGKMFADDKSTKFTRSKSSDVVGEARSRATKQKTISLQAIEKERKLIKFTDTINLNESSNIFINMLDAGDPLASPKGGLKLDSNFSFEDSGCDMSSTDSNQRFESGVIDCDEEQNLSYESEEGTPLTMSIDSLAKSSKHQRYLPKDLETHISESIFEVDSLDEFGDDGSDSDSITFVFLGPETISKSRETIVKNKQMKNNTRIGDLTTSAPQLSCFENAEESLQKQNESLPVECQKMVDEMKGLLDKIRDTCKSLEDKSKKVKDSSRNASLEASSVEYQKMVDRMKILFDEVQDTQLATGHCKVAQDSHTYRSFGAQSRPLEEVQEFKHFPNAHRSESTRSLETCTNNSMVDQIIQTSSRCLVEEDGIEQSSSIGNSLKEKFHGVVKTRGLRSNMDSAINSPIGTHKELQCLMNHQTKSSATNTESQSFHLLGPIVDEVGEVFNMQRRSEELMEEKLMVDQIIQTSSRCLFEEHDIGNLPEKKFHEVVETRINSSIEPNKSPQCSWTQNVATNTESQPFYLMDPIVDEVGEVSSASLQFNVQKKSEEQSFSIGNFSEKKIHGVVETKIRPSIGANKLPQCSRTQNVATNTENQTFHLMDPIVDEVGEISSAMLKSFNVQNKSEEQSSSIENLPEKKYHGVVEANKSPQCSWTQNVATNTQSQTFHLMDPIVDEVSLAISKSLQFNVQKKSEELMVDRVIQTSSRCLVEENGIEQSSSIGNLPEKKFHRVVESRIRSSIGSDESPQCSWTQNVATNTSQPFYLMDPMEEKLMLDQVIQTDDGGIKTECRPYGLPKRMQNQIVQTPSRFLPREYRNSSKGTDREKKNAPNKANGTRTRGGIGAVHAPEEFLTMGKSKDFRRPLKRRVVQQFPGKSPMSQTPSVLKSSDQSDSDDESELLETLHNLSIATDELSFQLMKDEEYSNQKSKLKPFCSTPNSKINTLNDSEDGIFFKGNRSHFQPKNYPESHRRGDKLERLYKTATVESGIARKEMKSAWKCLQKNPIIGRVEDQYADLNDRLIQDEYCMDGTIFSRHKLEKRRISGVNSKTKSQNCTLDYQVPLEFKNMNSVDFNYSSLSSSKSPNIYSINRLKPSSSKCGSSRDEDPLKISDGMNDAVRRIRHRFKYLYDIPTPDDYKCLPDTISQETSSYLLHNIA